MSRFIQCREELGKIGVIVAVDDLVGISLLGLPKSQHNYQDSMIGRKRLPDLECLWSSLVQEEIRCNTRDETSSNCEDEDNCEEILQILYKSCSETI